MVVVGRYVLYDALASGGMATVHLGRLVGEGGFSRTVAIKRLHPHFAKTPAFVSMLMDEARLAGRVRHPNVVPVVDVLSKDGELLLVMDYVHGETLARLLRRIKETGARVAPELAVSIMCDVLEGLHAAHEARDERGEPLGIVHRDVSPQNIMVGVDGIARVLDFGVAKAVGRLQETREGQLKGKLSYMAPEQLDQQASRSSDVFSAGVVLWETLTNERLFQGDTEAQTVLRVIAAQVEPPSVIAGTPKELDAIVLRALAAKPEARFATAQEMAVALAQCVPRASRDDVARLVDSLAHDAVAARAELVSSIESAPPLDVRAPGAPANALRNMESDSIVLSKRWLSVIAGAIVTFIATATIVSVTTPSVPTASPTSVPTPPPRKPVDDTPMAVARPVPPLSEETTSQPTATAAPHASIIVQMPKWSPIRKDGNVFTQASELASSGDNAGARALLEPRVFGTHKATSDEVHLLQGICKMQRDKNCLVAIAGRMME